ncbi:bifunctional glycosyl transferase/transpeptidase, partial [Photorhabdus luminescens]
MSGEDRQPIGRKGKKLVSRSKGPLKRRYRLDDNGYEDDDYDDEEDQPMTTKGMYSRPPKKKWRWFWLLFKIFIIFAVLLAAYGVYLDAKIRDRI